MRAATAFSILLFTETSQPNGFFFQEKATLHNVTSAAFESKML
jgi:hypothetical protein